MLEREIVSCAQEPWRRLSGIHGLRQARNLAVARELWTARDDYAREIDTAPGRLVPDGSLVAAARALPATKRDLAAIKEFTGRASRSQLDRWFAAIQRGMTTEDLPQVRPQTDTLPPPRVWAEKNPDADGRFKRARADVTDVGRPNSTSRSRTCSPRNTCAASRGRRPTRSPREAVGAALAALGARPWQIDAIAQVIADAFVRIDQTPEDPDEDRFVGRIKRFRAPRRRCLGSSQPFT